MNSDVSKKIAAFFESYDARILEKNTLVTLAGNDPEYITYLIEGIIEQYHITPQGNKVVVNVFKPPAFFPMSWAINNTENKYFYETVTDVTVRQAEPQATVEFLRNNPDVTFDLLSRVYRGTDALLRRIILAASGVAVNRIIFELLIEAYRFGNEIDSNQRQVVIKQTHIASRSGLARETVSRELHKLAQGEYISFTQQGFILNIPKLEGLLDVSI